MFYTSENEITNLIRTGILTEIVTPSPRAPNEARSSIKVLNTSKTIPLFKIIGNSDNF